MRKLNDGSYNTDKGFHFVLTGKEKHGHLIKIIKLVNQYQMMIHGHLLKWLKMELLKKYQFQIGL